MSKNPVYVYLIEQVFVDSGEKIECKAIKWKACGFLMNENEAIELCKKKGKFYTNKDSIFIKEYLRQYRYSKINFINIKV